MRNIIEQCRVAPPPDTVAEASIPLSCFDLRIRRGRKLLIVHHLIFHDYPYSKTHFMETTIPSLKHSLSLTLKHYYALAGNLVFPTQSGYPEIRYSEGDYVSVIFAESSDDFDDLTGNHARRLDRFYLLAHEPQPPTVTSDSLVAPVLEVQVTLFPDCGICIAINISHVIVDGKAANNFVRSWAAISKFGGDNGSLLLNCDAFNVPIYDRKFVRKYLNEDLETLFWNQIKESNSNASTEFIENHKEMVRVTFEMDRKQVQKLKHLVTAHLPSLSHVSTYTVACAFIWSCIIKADRAISDQLEVDDKDETQIFLTGVDCRPLFDPPVPANYFGSCIAPILMPVKTSQLIGEDGYIVAAKVIGETLGEKLHKHNGEGVLEGAEKWISLLEQVKNQVCRTTGSPRFAVYGLDFGWGKPKKNEILSTPLSRSIVLTERKDGKEGLEISLCFTKAKMNAFSKIFAKEVEIINCGDADGHHL